MEQQYFCNICGTQMINGVCPKCESQQANSGAPRLAPVSSGAPMGGAYGNPSPAGQGAYGSPYGAPGQGKAGGIYQPIADSNGKFATSDEQLIMQIGSGYIENILSGAGFLNNSAAVTNKRVYYSGKSFTSFGIGTKRCKAVQSVDLKDITGIGIYSLFNLAGIIIGGLLVLFSIVMLAWFARAVYMWLPTLIIGLISIFAALIGARTILRIDYAGGCIALNMRRYSRSECTRFQKAVIAAKDNITNYR